MSILQQVSDQTSRQFGMLFVAKLLFREAIQKFPKDKGARWVRNYIADLYSVVDAGQIEYILLMSKICKVYDFLNLVFELTHFDVVILENVVALYDGFQVQLQGLEVRQVEMPDGLA